VSACFLSGKSQTNIERENTWRRRGETVEWEWETLGSLVDAADPCESPFSGGAIQFSPSLRQLIGVLCNKVSISVPD